MRKKILFGWMVVSLLLTGCQKEDVLRTQKNDVSTSEDVFAMDTYMTVTAYGDNADEAVKKSIEEIHRLDDLLSTGKEDSEITQLNQKGRENVTKDTEILLERSLELWQDTDGIFEIGIYPLMEAWGFTKKEYHVPSQEVLDELLPLADSSQILLDSEDSTVEFLKDGMEIDLGGIAKGYTSQRIMEIFEENQISSGMVSLGGNVQVKGRKTDGSLWKVAIQSPDEKDENLGILQAEDCAVITSGGYQRYFEEDGVTYHHILDPSTGYPAQSGLVSVTIVSKDGVAADGLSTSLFVMGEEKAIDYWRKHKDKFDAIMLDEKGNLCVTEGIRDQFTSSREITFVQ